MSDQAAIINRLQSVVTKLDGIQEQIYIISGIAGGLIAILIVVIIVIAVKLSNIRSSLRAANRTGQTVPEDLSKRGFSAYTGKTEVSAPMQTIAVAPPVQQPQRQQQQSQQSFSPQVTSPRRTEGFSYDNNGYNEQQRQQRPANPNGNGNQNIHGGHNVHGHHGVQVLPKNPPPPRGVQQTDGFY